MTNPITVTIPAHLIRAAQSCQANKDVRHYLNGILLAANGDIVGTDGHTLVKTFSKELAGLGLTENLIVGIDGKMAKTTKHCTFTFNTQERAGKQVIVDGTVDCVGNRSSKIFSFSVIDGRYPDYSRVIPCGGVGRKPKKGEQISAFNLCNLNATYLARSAVFAEVGRYSGVTLHIPENANNAMTITPTESDWPQGTVMVIMPMRPEENERSVNGGTALYPVDNAA